MPADPAATQGAPETVETTDSTAPESQQPRQITSTEAQDLMQRLSIPKELRSELPQETPTEQEPAPEGDEQNPEVDIPMLEEETPKDEETEIEGDEEEDEIPQGKQPDVAKLQKRNYKLRQRARRAEDEAAELKARLDAIGTQEPVTITPSVADPLAHVTTAEQLETERTQFEFLRDMAEDHPDGWIAHEGTPQEVTVSAEQAKQYRRYANDTLNKQFPRKEKEIAQIRPKATAIAKQILPAMLKQGSEDYVAAHVLWKQEPMLAAHPRRDELTAVFLRGYKAILEDQKNGQQTKEKLEIPEKILKAHEQRDKTPVQKQTPPGRPTGNGAPKADELAKATDKLSQTGDRRDLANALRILNQSSAGKNGHALVSV